MAESGEVEMVWRVSCKGKKRGMQTGRLDKGDVQCY